MYKYFIFIAITSSLLVACNAKNEAEIIIENAIARHGGAAYDQLDLNFDFREIKYGLVRDRRQFIYSRTFIDSLGIRHDDTLNNEGFVHWEDGKEKTLAPEVMTAKKEALNSVMYFALLPQPLADDAVIADYVGEVLLNGKEYYKIKVTFSETGGGTDYQDVFLYWFSKEDYTLDYLAYTYEVEGGGARFRKAVNQREAGGILWNDYSNYKAPIAQNEFMKVDSLFEAGSLDSLSYINLENIIFN